MAISTQIQDEYPVPEQEEKQTLLRVEGLTKFFPISGGMFRKAKSFVHAVDDVSFELKQGESLGIVGESGSGKTTLGKLVMGLIRPTSGTIRLKEDTQGDVDVTRLKGRSLKSFRRAAQMIFQDPYEAMSPRLTVSGIVSEPLSVQGIGNPVQRLEKASEALDTVGLTPPKRFLFRYPHELSGGQRQRVAIARALVLGPSLVVADEPTSMLDVSVRTSVIRLMSGLAENLNISYIFITHDLATARYMCDRIAVMYLGKIVEIGQTEDILKNPQHPYTKALLSAIPNPRPGHKRLPVDIKSGISKPIDPPNRCRFYDRCPIAIEFCNAAPVPPLESRGEGHLTACYRA